ncbi:uncharacterized protein LOC108606104 [Drosophila busckii]|uniref:uncharacterized protein LOC108606104 n=1 Tax=Drosophila busckii TaxID=30019 RepID=UPI00083EE15B|nr:uncharacterized protein LOC108606104 [Drosophila busckii]
MRAIVFSALLILSSVLFVESINYTQASNLTTLLNSMSNVVYKYHSEFDTKVKFAKLQEVLTSIDKSMLDYQGTAKKKLDSVRDKNSEARLKYEDCVGPVFQWCVSLNSIFEIVIGRLNADLNNEDRDAIWNITVKTLSDGQRVTYDSLEILKEVQMKTAYLKNSLESMLHDLHDDFGPNGYYGKRRSEINELAKRKVRQAVRYTIFISGLFDAIIITVKSRVGHSLSLQAIFINAGLEKVINGEKKKPSYSEQLETIQVFFNTLNDKITHASEVATEVNKELEVDKKNLYALRGFLNGADTSKHLLFHNHMRSLLKPSFENLSGQCIAYAKWHGFDSDNYPELTHNRVRRQASEQCQHQRLNAMTKTIGSHPALITLEDLASKAHFIVNTIDCESPIVAE